MNELIPGDVSFRSFPSSLICPARTFDTLVFTTDTGFKSQLTRFQGVSVRWRWPGFPCPCCISTDTLASFHRPKHQGSFRLTGADVRERVAWVSCHGLSTCPGCLQRRNTHSNKQSVVALFSEHQTLLRVTKYASKDPSKYPSKYPSKCHCPLQTCSPIQRCHSWLETKATKWLRANGVAKASAAFLPHRTLVQMLYYKDVRTLAPFQHWTR